MQHMSKQSDIDLKVVGFSGDSVHLALSIPSQTLAAFQALLASSTQLLNFVALKSRHEKAAAGVLDLDRRLEREKLLVARDNKLFSLYDAYRSSGLDHRAAVKATKDHFQEFNCSQVEMTLRDRRRLQKKQVVS